MITGGYGERIADILHDARLGLFVGMIRDQEALDEAMRLGLVRFRYQGAAGFLGLPKLELAEHAP